MYTFSSLDVGLATVIGTHICDYVLIELCLENMRPIMIVANGIGPVYLATGFGHSGYT